MTTIYTIYTISEWSLSSGTSISSFSDKEEWKNKIDVIANDSNRNNTYYSLTAGVYSVPEDSESKIETVHSFDFRGERHKRVNLSIDEIPENWTLVEEQKIEYFSIWKNDEGEYTDGDNIYDSRKEALDICKPSQYMSIA